ncbi:MAG TPA: TonB-dependent receptor [Steroidobacteraceae bacterium]|jgi:outer membrane receptor protein involved in Fe transport
MFRSDFNQAADCGRSLFKIRTLTAVNAVALVAGSFATTHAAFAQEAPSNTDQLEQVVVTGSRIAREGYEAPTPLTVISAESLQRGTATANVADTLNTLPVFSNSQSPEGNVSGISDGAQGLNVLNLRGMGGNRTLTLFDGQRSVPSLFSGEVDVNNFPQQLISRVETVTGGGSAVYGSDAVAGVVNFILDKKFTGFKSEVTTGETTYGDDQSYKVSLTNGFGFAEDRGHVLLSGEIADRDGVTPGDGGRDWNYGGWGILVNPSYTANNGQPEYLVRPHVSLSNATHGGIIIAGPLRGTAFGQGGAPYAFNYGPITNDPWMQGGDWQSTEVRHDRSGTLEPSNRRRNLFGRVSYDVTDNVNVYAQAAWGDNRTYTATWPPFQAGSGPTILSGNPYIPASVQAQMTALNLPSFKIGSMNYDLPTVANDVNRVTNRYVVGAEGKFVAFDNTWTWNAYYQYGKTESTTDVIGVVQTARYAQAIDAVLDPNTGAIVCRSTLTDRSNGCSPWNPLGIGVNNQAGLDYVTGTSSVVQTLQQDVFAASVQGEVFSTWAGPVSVALSAEHREDKAEGVPSGGGPWFAGNFSAFNAKNDVTEGAFETVVPLAKGMKWADSLDVNAAVRSTDYQYSGRVTTWKYGAVWAPVQGLKFRGTRSRDIRAPNFNELFAASNSGQRSAFDPFTNTIQQYFGANAGNPNLKPEQGDTYEFGVVFQPSFMPGFSASVDYWNIKLTGAIGRPNDNQTLQFCFEGQTSFCDNIQRDGAGVITQVTLIPFNLASQKKSGIDFEVSQTLDASSLFSSWQGQLSFTGLGTLYKTSSQDDGFGAGAYSTLGDMGQLIVGPPDWRLTANLAYSLDAFRTSLTARAQSDGVIDTRYIECTSGCPTSGAVAKTIEDNHIPSTYYLDASFSYEFAMENMKLEAFFNVKNLLNRDPEIVPLGPTDFTYVSPLSKAASGFDLLGRAYLLGVRIRM